MDQAGRHRTDAFIIPETISNISLPAKCPERWSGDPSGSATGPRVVTPAPSVVPGNDALSIAAGLIRESTTGGGNDAAALVGAAVGQLDTGAGAATIRVKAVAVAGITGGDGNDTIAVDAGIGAAGFRAAQGMFGLAQGPTAVTVQAKADGNGGAGNAVN